MALVVVQARDDSCSEDGDKWVDRGHAVEIESTVPDDGVAMECGRDVQDDMQVSGLDNGMGGCVIQ